MARGRGHWARAYDAVIASCAFAGLAAQAQDAPPTAPVMLEEGVEVQQSHSASDRYVYVAEITDDETYLLRIEQANLDLIVTVRGSNDEPAVHDSPLFRDGSETIVLGPAARGTYRIELHSEEHTGASGGHVIALRRLTPTADQREVTAWRWMSDAGAANARRNEDGWDVATLAYARAAELWSELGRPAEEADALFAEATLEYWQRFNWPRAAQLAAEAESLYEAQGLAKLAANAVHLRAAALIEQAIETKQSAEGAGPDAMFAEALALLERARESHERLGNTYELGLVTNNFGYLFYNKGEFDRARPYYEQAAVLMRGIDEWRGELSPLSNTAAIDAEEGNLLAAADTFRRMLDLLPEGKLAQYRAATLDNLGATELLLGNLEEALRIFDEVLAAQRALSERQGEGRVLARIGQAYFGLGELELAAQYLDQALPIALGSNDGRTRGGVHSVRGDIAYAQRDYEMALEEHTNALELAASSADRAHLQRLIAKDLIALGRYDEAKELAAAVRAGALETGSESLLAHASLEEGRAELLRGSPARAQELFLEAQQIFGRLGLHSANAETLYSLSLAAVAQGRLTDAIELGARALDELEALRVRVLEPTLRASFAATRRGYYETQIDSLMKLHAGGNDAASLRAAFETSERGRARIVADLLQEASIDVRSSLAPDLLARQRELYARLADRVQRRDAALRAGSAAGAVQDVVAEIAAIENDLKLLEIEWRRRSPEFASLTAPATLTLAEIQSGLGGDEVLLQYAIGARASHAWVVTQDGIVGVELAGAAAIDAAARRVLDAMGPLDQTGAAVNAALTDLARLVLQPVEPHLRGRTLVLALDGMLQYVPFAALPTSRGPLLAAHSLVAVPSMSALTAAPRREPPAKTLAVFADPVLEQNDPRFATTIAPAAERMAEASLAMRAGVQSFGRLLSTAYEADAISALVPPDEALVAHGFAATRDAVLTTDLRDYRYIHFATHGIVDSRHPALSALMLSRYDDRGAPQDGFLRLHDIFDLEVGADVVVLSACETALGRDVRGEGLLGLTQGFMYAGARSLVASLWQVPDRATAELMTRFYSYMLNDGMSPVDALRQAQSSLAGERRFSHPYYWAGFALLGDWR